MDKKTSIIDVPRTPDQTDLFGIEKYKDALSEFIRRANTPITIALQGEWGSGKTSLMNSLQSELCNKDNSTFYGIWVNTWQYSLLRSPQSTLIKIIEGLTNNIIDIIKENHQGKTEALLKTAGRFLKKTAIELAKAGSEKLMSGSGKVIEAVTENDEKEPMLSDFRAELQKSINELIQFETKKNTSKRGLIFFIDDLDRIDPPIAVQILELLKNIFDLEQCVFVLAIDYDVVIKGLRPKFGELTDKNEREFRSFFDKIIQLPFSMPVASYQIDQFLTNALSEISFIEGEEMNDTIFKEKLTEFANLSVGSNPRALKRLTNTLSLIGLINKVDNEETETEERSNEKLINFAMVCIQIAYPYVYNTLIKDPNFIAWDEQKAQKLKLKPLSEEEQIQLNATPEFDEAWEKVLFQICQKETYSSNRVFQISQLLNHIRQLIPNEEMLGETVGNILELSAVTNLEAFDKPKQALNISSVLKGMRDKLIKIVPQILDKPFTYQQQGRSIKKNLVMKLTKNDWEYYIVYQARPDNNQFVFYMGNWGVWLLKSKTDDIDTDINNAGIEKEINELYAKIESIAQKHTPNFEDFHLWKNPKDAWFMKNDRKLGKYHILPVWFRINLKDALQFTSDDFILKIADITKDYSELLIAMKLIGQKKL